jgi:hypothetical protein
MSCEDEGVDVWALPVGAGVEVGGGPGSAIQSHTASRKFTVNRSLAWGYAGEKPSNLFRAAL